MAVNIPHTHLVESKKLVADAFVDLMEMRLVSNVLIRWKNNGAGTWQGKLFEHLPFTLTGVDKSADEEESRPTLNVANYGGVFSSYVVNDELYKAVVTRYRVLKADFENNVNVYQQKTWYVSRLALVTSDLISIELRDLVDGPNFLIPARIYIPPDFPMVSIG